MRDNLVAKRSTLDKMIDILGMTDEESGMPPVLDEERGFVKLQMLCAQTLSRDAIEMNKRNPQYDLQDALNDSCKNFVANIHTIATEILKNPKMQMDITKNLKKINKMPM